TVVDGVSKSIIEADLITSSHADHDTVHIHNAWTIAGLKIPGKLHIITDVDQQITQRHGLTKRLQVLLVVIVSRRIISFEYLHGVAFPDLIYGQGAHQDRNADGIDGLINQRARLAVTEGIDIRRILRPQHNIDVFARVCKFLGDVDVVIQHGPALRIELQA